MEQRNLLLAIVLSVGILIGFQFLIGKFYPPPPPPKPAATQTVAPKSGPTPPASGTAPAAPPTAAPSSASGAAPGTAGSAAGETQTREAAIAGQPRVKID